MPIVRHLQLTANTVATVTLPQTFDEIEVVNVDGSALVYFRIDGVDPALAGNDCEVLPAALGGQTLTVYGDDTLASSVVKLVSAGTPRVAVRAW